MSVSIQLQEIASIALKAFSNISASVSTVKVLLMLFKGMTGVRENGKRIDGLDEPLHCWITGTTAEDVKAAAKIIQEMIDMEIYNPDSEKAMALRVRCLTFNLRKTYK